MVLTNVKSSVLNFFILSKNICENVSFVKTLKDLHFFLGDITLGLFADI